MQYDLIGRTGVLGSRLSLGAWTFTDGDHVLKLHGTGAGISPLAEGDKLVMDLLAEPKPTTA